MKQLIIELNHDGKPRLNVDRIFDSYKVLVLRGPRCCEMSCLPNNQLHQIYTEIAESIGELVPMEECLQTGNKNGELWTDIQYNPSIENSYRHSNTRQPFHTDGSYESDAPNISCFYCMVAAKQGGATTFLDYDELLDCLDTKLRDRLESTPVLFSKGNDSKTRPIIHDGRLTWNYFRASSPEDPTLVEDFHRFLEDRIVESHIAVDIYLQSGDAVFFQDELLLHGRNAFFGNRWLKKGGLRWIKN